MPIYEYQCDGCGAQREVFVRSTDAPRPACPGCRKRMRRVISQTAFILKGSGWYVTEYPSDARKKGLEGEKAPVTPPSGAAETKTETPKPAGEVTPAAAGPGAPAPAKGRKKKR